MTRSLSKTQIDKLGDRLRKKPIRDEDLVTLDQHRRSYANSYDSTVSKIRGSLSLEPTGRPAKSTSSIVEKLLRESIRLSQVQDIAGCRLVVKSIPDQQEAVNALRQAFSRVAVVDRRNKPSSGYRAVHVVVEQDGKLIEIQVRTELQHLWAELSEKLSDVVDPQLKYGAGPEDQKKWLANLSALVASYERQEISLVAFKTEKAKADEYKRFNRKLKNIKKDISKILSEMIQEAEGGRGKKP